MLTKLKISNMKCLASSTENRKAMLRFNYINYITYKYTICLRKYRNRELAFFVTPSRVAAYRSLFACAVQVRDNLYLSVFNVPICLFLQILEYLGASATRVELHE